MTDPFKDIPDFPPEPEKELAGDDNQSETEELSEHDKCVESLMSAIFTTLQFKTMTVPERKPLIGTFLREGDIAFIHAQRGVGKTWYSIELAKAISSGTPFGPWKSHEAKNVLYVDGEVAAHDIQQRIRSLGADNERFLYLNHELLFDKTASVINIAEPAWQEAILELCKQRAVGVLFFDNLSCLAPGVDENDTAAWSRELLGFVLNLRRAGVSVIFVQHSGRNGQMRGHSRREDPANWIIRLTKRESDCGAKFIARFDKLRNGATWPETLEWHFRPDGESIEVAYKNADSMDIFLELVESGVDNNADIAVEMDVTKGYVSQLAAKAINNDCIRKKGQRYEFLSY